MNGNARSASCEVEMLLGFRHDGSVASQGSVAAQLTVPGHEEAYTWQVTVPNGWTVGLNLGNLPAAASSAGLALSLIDVSTGVAAPVGTVPLPGPATCIARAAAPAISPVDGGAFLGAVAVFLASAEAGAALHYTLSGATQQGPSLYDGTPIIIAGCGATTVRAWASRPGVQDSAAVQVSYAVEAVAITGGRGSGASCVAAQPLAPVSTAVSADGAVAAESTTVTPTVPASMRLAGSGGRSATCGVAVSLSFADPRTDVLARSFLLVVTREGTNQAAAEVAAEAATAASAAEAADGAPAAAEGIAAARRRLQLAGASDVSAPYLNVLLAQAIAVTPITLANQHATEVALGNLPSGSQLLLFASPEPASELLVSDTTAGADSGQAPAALDPRSFTLAVGGAVAVPDSCGVKLPPPGISAASASGAGSDAGTAVHRRMQLETHYNGSVLVSIASSLPGSVVYVTTDGSSPASSATALFSSLLGSVEASAHVAFQLTAPGCTTVRAYTVSATAGASDEASAVYCISYADSSTTVDLSAPAGAWTAGATDLCASGGDGIRCAPNNCGRLYYRCKGGVASPVYEAPAGFLCNGGELKGADDPTDPSADPAVEGVSRCLNNLCGLLPAPRPGNAAAVCMLPATGAVAATLTTPSATPTKSASVTRSRTPSRCSGSHTPPATLSSSKTPAATLSSSKTPAATLSSSKTPPASVSASKTGSGSATPTRSPSISASPSKFTSCSATPTASQCPYLRTNPPCGIEADGWSCIRDGTELNVYAMAVFHNIAVSQCTSMMQMCSGGVQTSAVSVMNGVACYGGAMVFADDPMCAPTVIPLPPGCVYPSLSASVTPSPCDVKVGEGRLPLLWRSERSAITARKSCICHDCRGREGLAIPTLLPLLVCASSTC
jgi:hypothetical protein